MADTTRIQYFLDKLEHPRNGYAKAMMPKWFKDSEDWACRMMENHEYHKKGSSVESLRVVYICNHMCPNMVHLKPHPVAPPPGFMNPESEYFKEYQRMLFEYEYENTQAAIANSRGEIIQEGIHQTKEEFDLIRKYVERMVTV